MDVLVTHKLEGDLPCFLDSIGKSFSQTALNKQLSQMSHKGCVKDEIPKDVLPTVSTKLFQERFRHGAVESIAVWTDLYVLSQPK